MQKKTVTKRMEKNTAKKARTSEKGEPPARPQEKEESADTYSVDPETLRCDICYKPFDGQIFMCKNGHPACADCCLRTDRRCSCCSEPVGDIRCRPLEKVLAGMTRPCAFKNLGCRETVSFTKRRSHEDGCRYAPYHCPFEDCDYYGLLLYNHIQDAHASSDSDDDAVLGCFRKTTVKLQKGMPFRVLLHRDGASIFLLLNGGDVLTGRSLSLVCMGPRPTGNAEVKYRNEVKGNEPGALLLSGSGTAPFIRRLEDFEAKGFLFVPNSYWDSAGAVSVTVHVTDGW